jgi:hypothetical protein
MIETRRFRALKDDGNIVTVIELQEQIRFRPLSGTASVVAGAKVLTLSDGSHVNFIDEDTFKIVETGEIVRRLPH